MADDQVLLKAHGEKLPKGPLDPDDVAVDYLFVSPHQAKDGPVLLEYLQHGGHGGRWYLLQMQQQRFGWKLITPDIKAVPQVNNQIHVFCLNETSSDWKNSATRLNKLWELFGSQIQYARTLTRSTARDPHCVLPTSFTLKDIGNYFPILGRQLTIDELLKGTWRLYKQFMTSEETGWDRFRRLQHLMGIVAFPGAGKTSIGKALPDILRQGRAGAAYAQDRREYFAQLFDSSVEDVADMDELFSCVEGHDVLMFHDFVTPSSSEANLNKQQLLGLRTLHAACTRADGNDKRHPEYNRWRQYGYLEFLADLDSNANGLKDHIIFDDVVSLLRKALGFANDDRFFISFFFDEVGRGNGQVQGMFREWIWWMHQNRGGRTFVTMVASTNIFTYSSLKESGDTGASQLIYIPVVPLEPAIQRDVVLRFINRLRLTANMPEVAFLSEPLDILLRLSGGNPRLLSFILEAVVSTDESTAVVPAQFQDMLLGNFNRDTIKIIIDRVWALIVKYEYFEGFMDRSKIYHYLLRAIQASLLRHSVGRQESVLPHRDPDYHWEWLEKIGLVAAVPSLEPTKVRVEFSPLYLLFLTRQRDDFFGQKSPDINGMQGGDWKDKEDSDVSTVVFSIYLLKELTNPGPLDTFSLPEVLPDDWYIPDHLKDRRFLFPKFPAKIQRYSPSNKMDVEKSNNWVYCGPRNKGFDTLIVLRELKEGGNIEYFVLYTESKCVGDPQKEPTANWNGVVAPKIRSDISQLVDVESATGSAEKYGLDQWGLLFISDMKNTSAQKAQQGYLSRSSSRSSFDMNMELAKRVVIAGGFGLVDNIAAVRHVKRHIVE